MEDTREKDFYISEGQEQRIIFHAPSGKMAVLMSNVENADWNDQLLYKQFPNLCKYKRKQGEFISNPKIKVVFISCKRCNLQCAYCFAHYGSFASKIIQSDFMSLECYKKTIEYLEKKHTCGIGSLSFFGGEPLLQFPVIKEFITGYYEELEKVGVFRPEVDISTNGTLITEEMAQFFREYDIKVALSLDGPKDLNDMGRKFKKVEFSVADSVKKAIELLEKYQVKYHLQMVIHKGHLEQYESGMAIEWLREFERPNCKSVAISPVVTDDPRFKIQGKKMLNNLECFAKDLTNNYIDQMVKPDPRILSLEMIAPLLHIVKNTYHEDCHAGYNLAVETNGDIYPCQMFIGNDEYLLGNVFEERFDDERARNLLGVKRQDCGECKKCIAKGVCTFFCKGIQNLENEGLSNPILCRCRFERTILIECIKRVALIKRETKEYQYFCENMRKLFGGM